jgi:integrase/recombinase XerD
MPKKPKTQTITWEQALDLFLTHLKARRSADRTVTCYRKDLERLQELVEPASPPDVTIDQLRDLQVRLLSGDAAQKGRPLDAGTVSRITSVWRSFFGFLTEEERLERDPTARLEHPKVPKRVPGDVLTQGELKRVLRSPDVTTPHGLRDHALLDLLFSTGLRSAEVQALDLGDVDHPQREIVVRAGKGDKGRIVPLTRSAYGSLRQYLDEARGTFVSGHRDGRTALFLTNRGRRIHHVFLHYLVKDACVAAGIKKRVSPHTFRRSFATLLLKNGVSVRHIQALLGHESLDTTAKYLRLDRAELRRELLLRHPRERIDA